MTPIALIEIELCRFGLHSHILRYKLYCKNVFSKIRPNVACNDYKKCSETHLVSLSTEKEALNDSTRDGSASAIFTPWI